MHYQSVQLVKHLCNEIVKLDHEKAASTLQAPLNIAAVKGVPEVVEEIFDAFPSAVYIRNELNQAVFHVAIANRREKVFNLIYQSRELGHAFLSPQDLSRNNGLHLAGCLKSQPKLNIRASAAGAALQMQRELQWFKKAQRNAHCRPIEDTKRTEPKVNGRRRRRTREPLGVAHGSLGHLLSWPLGRRPWQPLGCLLFAPPHLSTPGSGPRQVQEVEKLSPPQDKEWLNVEGKTPSELFTETHEELVKEGEKWMKDASTSCTIVAALIVTIVFAAAITVPGGNSDGSGLPILLKEKAFKVFAISDSLALFSSISSMLMFLSILTSRYAEDDFLYVLPKRLIIGLVTLFLATIFMMVAFGATLYFLFGHEEAWILIPVATLACLPVSLFASLQFPLLLDMFNSTYGSGIFGKQGDRILH
ncbi:unnamed protein product [Ilex paraguariensis]|uniref:PGG domain-containing protein n=1 Tax=Ilex paraguariensis TaxID=185542 RepID=A0ABC8QVX5_9AQUA